MLNNGIYYLKEGNVTSNFVIAFITLPETKTEVNANSAKTVTCSINYSDSPPAIEWYKGADEVTQGVSQSDSSQV